MVTEMMQYPYTLQVLCRVRPPCYFLINHLLSDDRLQGYLTAVCTEIAQVYARQAIRPVYLPDATCHSLFPLQYEALLGQQGAAALQPFEQCVVQVAEDGSCCYVWAQGVQPTGWRTRPDEPWNWMQPGESTVLQSGWKISLDYQSPESAVYKFEKAGRFAEPQGGGFQQPPIATPVGAGYGQEPIYAQPAGYGGDAGYGQPGAGYPPPQQGGYPQQGGW
jgi:hypothetical protein